MNGKEEHYPDYPLFKGLQRPLEFMGIQGRYIYWAAATIGIAIVGFIIAYCVAGFVLALIVLSVTVTSGVGLILFKQRKDCTANGRNVGCSSMPTQRKCNRKPFDHEWIY